MSRFDTRFQSPHRRIGLAFALSAWALLLALLAWLASGWLEERDSPMPETAFGPGGERQVILQRGPGGHYVARGLINGREVGLLVDTGATLVAVDESLADDLGLAKGRRLRLQTANGAVDGWHTRISTLDVGGLAVRDVAAAIQPALGHQVLLGMSFLARVAFAQQGDRLVLSLPQ